MIRLVGIALLASSLCCGGDASAGSWKHRHGPERSCPRDGVFYSPGDYCVSRHGIVEVCMGDGSWMSLGACLGMECRAAC